MAISGCWSCNWHVSKAFDLLINSLPLTWLWILIFMLWRLTYSACHRLKQSLLTVLYCIAHGQLLWSTRRPLLSHFLYDDLFAITKCHKNAFIPHKRKLFNFMANLHSSNPHDLLNNTSSYIICIMHYTALIHSLIYIYAIFYICNY